MIEEISVPSVESKIIGKFSDDEIVKLEVVLHSNEVDGEDFVLPELRRYLRRLSIDESLNRRLYANGLTLVAIEALAAQIREISKFTAIRVVRRIPHLRLA